MGLLGHKNKDKKETETVVKEETRQSVDITGFDSYELENGNMTIYLTGKIDASNSETIQEYIASLIDENELSELVFDMNDVTYVSSAGLRMFSALNQKSIEYSIEYRLINMRQDIQKMFQMTGYASAFSIETK